jgi:hypothetical protein
MRLFSLILVLAILSGCRSEPQPTGYVLPTNLIKQIASADRIVVTSLLAGHQGSPQFASFSLTITGQEMGRIIHAVCSLRAPKHDFPYTRSSCLYEWRLQFYRGTTLLGAADLSECLIECDGVEYDEPWALKRLYHHIAAKSGEEN